MAARSPQFAGTGTLAMTNEKGAAHARRSKSEGEPVLESWLLLGAGLDAEIR
jgi:hypothetical protein